MAKLTAAKAKEILKDGSVRGKKLSARQKRFFGAIAGGQRPRNAGSQNSPFVHGSIPRFLAVGKMGTLNN